MSGKPTYLGLLNAIASGEARGHELLKAWSAVTPEPGLRAVLEIVSIREAEHAAAFRKRLCELGYDVRQTPSARFTDDLALARSAATDQEKFDRLIESDTREAADDPLSRLFEDKTIDPETGALLGRFIAEERDSERRLRAARLALQPIRSGADRDPGDEALLSDILTRLDRLSVTLDSLKSLRAQ